MCVCVCVRACVRACVCACMYVCMYIYLLITALATVRHLATAALPEVEAGGTVVLSVRHRVRLVASRPDGLPLWRQDPHQRGDREQQPDARRHIIRCSRPGTETITNAAFQFARRTIYRE